jgi:heme exporter protein A
MHAQAGEALVRLIVQGLTSIRGGRTLFRGLSVGIAAGEALVVSGPNGAGKTTLLRIIAGFLKPMEGVLRLEGGVGDRTLGEQCHYVGHLNSLKSGLSVEENAAFWGDFLGGTRTRVAEALATFGLARLRDIPTAYLSAGQKRRLGLARLLLAERPLWLLDEPAVSLDQDGLNLISGVIETHLVAGGLVVLATHQKLPLSKSANLSLGAPASRA